jgi:Septum formation
VPIRTRALTGALLLAMALAAGACGDDDDDDAGSGEGATTTSPEAEEETVFAVDVGDCLASDPSGEEITEVPTVDCEEPHQSEAFHTATIEGEELPPSAEIERLVQEECLAEFESFVGMPYEQSALEVIWLEPTEESWEQGDRELVCLVTDPAAQTTGSLQGANR